MSRRVALVAGEVSGDTLGAGLIRALSARDPSIRFEGVGGPQMQEAGMRCWHDADELAVMGITEVVRHLPRLLRLRRGLARRWRQSPPDVFVGIDAPDFNLGLEKKLRAGGVPTVHYVSPSVWAWREGRVKKIAKACDRVLCLLPFEPDFYQKHQVAADFVGHPLAQRIQPVSDTAPGKRDLGLDPERPVLALLPGSRSGEIARLGADFIGAAALCRRAIPELQIVVPLANERGATQFRELLAGSDLDDVDRISVGDARECMRAADVLLMASGTAALEGLLHARPMIVAYRVSPSTYRLVTSLGLIKVSRYSLPNLLTERPLVDEFIQDAVQPEALAQAVLQLLRDPERIAQMQHAFAAVHERLAIDSDQLAAAAVAEAAGLSGR